MHFRNLSFLFKLGTCISKEYFCMKIVVNWYAQTVGFIQTLMFWGGTRGHGAADMLGSASTNHWCFLQMKFQEFFCRKRCAFPLLINIL